MQIIALHTWLKFYLSISFTGSFSCLSSLSGYLLILVGWDFFFFFSVLRLDSTVLSILESSCRMVILDSHDNPAHATQ